MRLAKEAGLDLLRVHAHITRTELYDAADEQGLLLWQDLPLQWGYSRSVRKQAVRQADAAVRLLGHHPSVAIWCGHNEPLAIDTTEIGRSPVELVKVASRFFAGMELPTFNRSILDRAIAKTLRRADGTRPVIPHSGVWPHLPQLDGTDTHIYFGWYHGSERDLPRFLAAVPRMARFVTEFGSQAIPDTDDFLEPERWPDLDWDRLTERHKLQRTQPRALRARRRARRTFDEWRAATQRYQSLVIDRHIRELRRIKYRPNGGFAQFAFADAAPAGVLVGPRPRAGAQARLRGPPPGLRAGHRRRRPAARVDAPGPGHRRGRARRVRPAPAPPRPAVHRDAVVAGRCAPLAVRRRRGGRLRRPGRHAPVRGPARGEASSSSSSRSAARDCPSP